MKRPLAALSLLVVVAGCGSSGSSSSSATPTSPSAALVSLTGVVNAAASGAVGNALVQILDGPNAGVSATTNSAGQYTISGLTVGNANVSASGGIWAAVTQGVYINGTNTLNFLFPVPACQSNNTATVTFTDHSPLLSEDIVWDGVKLLSLSAGQTSAVITAAAGNHTLQVFSAGTQTLICSATAPALTQCSSSSLGC